MSNQSGAIRVAYIGWTGENNIGDEAMYWSQRVILGPEVSLIPVPLVGDNVVLRRFAAEKIDAVCLGGGTLIGNGHFGHALGALQQAKPTAHYFMLGVGCESHEYTEGNRRAVHQELETWKHLLGSFQKVRVRGPQSRETLGVFGVNSEISGDPALLLPRWFDIVDRGIVGLNIGSSEDSYGDAASDPLELMNEMASVITKAGFTVMLLPTTADDFRLCQRFLTTSPHRVMCHPRMLDFHEYSKAVAQCNFLVGMKLHSLVIAASQGVPPIALEYRPKCSDFMRSVGFGERTMRLDGIDSSELRKWFTEYDRDRDRLAKELEDAVHGQRERLRTIAESERAKLLGSSIGSV
ncbi:MAG: polysaccharide pyruvyl transferase family protein [Gordonia polyisoprenivorans]|nr:polysaccharide pyruvyl transferase family protein [Gordonia polyisoprenivorans]